MSTDLRKRLALGLVSHFAFLLAFLLHFFGLVTKIRLLALEACAVMQALNALIFVYIT